MSRLRTSGVMMLLALAAIPAACRVETVEVTRSVPAEVTRVVVETIVQAGVEVEVTRLATRELEVMPDVGPDDEEPVTLDIAWTGDISTLDPQMVSDAVSILYIENLFVQLTNGEPETGRVVPEAATSWEISADGRTYTFHLRNDIPWVYHNPVTGETTQVTDEEGRPRFVTAEDFAEGIRRACDRSIASFYSGVVGRVIAGCQAMLLNEDPQREQAFLEALGVEAPDAETLIIGLEYPAGYFLSMTPLWTLSAIPSWTIEEHGDPNWYEAGIIVTSGRYVLHEWVHGLRQTIMRNSLMPPDMRGEGNIERVVGHIVPDVGTEYALWLDSEVDLSSLPDAEVGAHLEQYGDKTLQSSSMGVGYIGFVNSKPPFDDPQVRRAFSAAIDRESLTREVLQGQGVPMIHFAPPGIFGAPPIDEVGVGFDPEYAREQLAAAGYPNCEGFPTVSLLGFSGPDFLNQIEYFQGQWEQYLGCSAPIIQIEQMPFDELLSALDASLPVEEVPHMYTLGWGADYLDENNWVGDVLWCGNEQSLLRRSCSAIDDLIIEAAEEPDPERRLALYRQIEEAFFGAQGEMPFAPLYQQKSYLAVHDWLDRTPVEHTNQFFNWYIDWETKQQAQE